jgi:importin subunit alpha-6/7
VEKYVLPINIDLYKLKIIFVVTFFSSLYSYIQPLPSMETIKLALPVLARLLYSEDYDTLNDALWALSYFTDSDEGILLQLAVEVGVCSRLPELLRHESPSIQTPALRCIGNIVTGDEIQTQVIINHGALDSLYYVLQGNRKALKKEACWAVSNVMAGNKEQIQAAVDANLVNQLVVILKGSNKETKREACWALSNTTSGGTPQHVSIYIFLIISMVQR